MSTTYQIEFIRTLKGKFQAEVIERVIVEMEAPSLDAIRARAAKLPRPTGASGFQIREDEGPVRYTLLF